LLKIKINKNENNWIFTDKYSNFPDEAEVVLNKNLFFRVLNKSYEVVSCDRLCTREGGLCYRDILTYELEIVNNLIPPQQALPVRPIQANPAFNAQRIIDRADPRRINQPRDLIDNQDRERQIAPIARVNNVAPIERQNAPIVDNAPIARINNAAPIVNNSTTIERPNIPNDVITQARSITERLPSGSILYNNPLDLTDNLLINIPVKSGDTLKTDTEELLKILKPIVEKLFKTTSKNTLIGGSKDDAKFKNKYLKYKLKYLKLKENK
jgi:hypothetical protein